MRQNRQNGPHLTILSQRQSWSHSATYFEDKKFLSTTVGEGLSKQALDQRHQWLAHGASNRSVSWTLAPNSVGAAAIRHRRYSNLVLQQTARFSYFNSKETEDYSTRLIFLLLLLLKENKGRLKTLMSDDIYEITWEQSAWTHSHPLVR